MSNPRLLTIPIELFLKITSKLEFPDDINLRNTCKTLHARLPGLTGTGLERADKSNFAIEQWLLACYQCGRIRIAGKFVDSARKGMHRRGRVRRSQRCCTECATSDGGPGGAVRYHSLTQDWKVLDKLHYICRACRKFGRAPHDQDGVAWRLCVTCWAAAAAFQQNKIRLNREARERRKQNARRAQRIAWHGSSFWEADDAIPDSPARSDMGYDQISASRASRTDHDRLTTGQSMSEAVVLEFISTMQPSGAA